MSKKIQAVNPRTGKWESATVVEGVRATAQTGTKGREHVVVVEFADGQKVEQPTWATSK